MGVRAWAGNGIIVTLQIQWDGEGVAAHWTLYLEFAKSLRTNSCEIVISYSGHNWLSVILWIKFCWQSTVLTRRIEEVSDKLLWTVDCILSVFLTPIIRKWWVTTSAEEQFLGPPNSHHTNLNHHYCFTLLIINPCCDWEIAFLTFTLNIKDQ